MKTSLVWYSRGWEEAMSDTNDMRSSSFGVEGSDDQLQLRTKIWFGVGTMGESATNWIFVVLTFIYYQQILGLSGSLAGIAVAIAIIADAITDPIIGSISDRFQSRLGRRHPFMFAAPIPLAASIFLIFNPPEILVDSQTGLFFWLTIFTICMRTFSTFFAVPHLAMGAELSTDYIERTNVMSYNNLFGYYGGFTMHCFVWFFVFGWLYETEGQALGGAQLFGPAYVPVVAFCCLLVMASIFCSAWFTRDRIPLMNPPPSDGQGFSPKRLFLDMWEAIQNRNYLFLLIGLFFLSMTIGTHETLGIYMGTFFWELSPIQIGVLILSNFIGFHLGFVFSSRVHTRIDKRWTIVASAAGLSFFWSAAVNLALLGYAPDNSTWELVAFIIFWGIFSSACGSVVNISVMSALADITDEHEAKTGRRQEGIFYSARTFFAKASNAMGHVVAGFAIEYYILIEPGSIQGQVPEDVLFRLGVIDGPFAMVWGLIAAFFYAGYRINKSSYEKVQEQLKLQRAEKESD